MISFVILYYDYILYACKIALMDCPKDLSFQINWRVVGSKGTVQVERGNVDGRHGYLVKQKLTLQEMIFLKETIILEVIASGVIAGFILFN